MRCRSAHDARVAELTRRRLAALTAELGGHDQLPVEERPVVGGVPAGEPPDGRVGVGGRHARRPAGVGARVGGWLLDRVPMPFQGRAHLGSAQVGVVCLIVALGLVLAAWWLVRAAGAGGAGELVAPRPVVTGAAVPTPTAPAAAPVPSSPAPPTGTPSTGQRIVVDVVGKVRRPGIVVLAAGSRVADAVRAAGGMRPGVTPTSVNLARVLVDGEQVAVGLPAAAGSQAGAALATPGAPDGGALVNLNTADQAALETLPGVGPVTAAAILEWRAEHGGFTSVDELLDVSGIGDATLAEIAPHVTL